MKLFFYIFIVLTFVYNYTWAQAKVMTIPVKAQPIHFYPLTKSLVDVTFFIEDPSDSGHTGTAFVLSRFVGETMYFKSVLISAAHVLKGIEGEYADLWIRRKNSKNLFEDFRYKIKIRENNIPLWVQPNQKIDVAAMYLDNYIDTTVPNLNYKILATDGTIDTLNLSIGDEAMCLGYPHNTPSSVTGFPILRSGKIASYPITPTQTYNILLLDIPVYPGNSGGPVFTGISSINVDGKMLYRHPKIIGLISQKASSRNGEAIEVAEVVPSQFIIQAIESLPEIIIPKK